MQVHRQRIVGRLLVASCCMFLSLAGATIARAQTEGDPELGRQRAAAAEAYDRGTAAYLAGDHRQAAKWFETANRMAPAAPAVMQAIRAHLKTEDTARALTLALLLQRSYPEEESARNYAQHVLDEWSDTFGLIEVACDAHCSLELNGALQDTHYFFVDVDRSHRVVGHFETGDVSRDVSVGKGEHAHLDLAAPAARQSDLAPQALDVEEASLGVSTSSTRALPPLVTFVGAGVTAALLGVSVWSWVDANQGVSGYEDLAGRCRATGDADACGDAQAALRAGQSKQTRSNLLTAATAAAALGTTAIALLFTDWSGNQRKSANGAAVQAGVAPVPGGATATLVGRF